MSWGWRKILQLRPTIREFIWCKVGNCKNTSLWFDRWRPASPIANHVSNRDISRSGLTFTSCVHDIIVNGNWNWPRDLLGKYLILNGCVTTISDDSDKLQWRLHDGMTRAGLDQLPHDIYAMVDQLGANASRKSSHIVIAKLVIAASAYFLWQERNWRLFKKTKRTIKQVTDCITFAIRLKLLTCRFKLSKDGLHYARLWELPDTIFR
nr:hypothetical protein [Tanacetum cinerariifolium]